jgi:cell division protein FtsB
MKKGIHFKKLIISSIVLIVFLLGIYIVQVNRLNFKSYLIASYQKEIKELSERNNDLEVQISLLESQDFTNIAKTLSFEKIKKIDYINIPKKTVAER